jgi:hypothetical protein
MSDPLRALDAARVKKATDQLIDLVHYMPTLHSEAATFSETCMTDDGQRTLKLGRHVALKLSRALDDMELMLPKT